MKDNRWCLICRPKNRSLYWHKDKEGKLWCWCNKCDRGYSLLQYCKLSDIEPTDFLEGKFFFQETENNEVQALSWPSTFIPLSDTRAAAGVEYIKSRGLTTNGDMYFDLEENGIVFPYYFDSHFCGAQIRFLETRFRDNGDPWKVTTLPCSRLGLLFYGWNQAKFMGNVKGIIVVEGAFDAIGINQAFNLVYGGIINNPWRAIACSGSGATNHQKEAIKELKDQGLKIIVAPDTDEPGFKMYNKFAEYGSCTHRAFTQEPGIDWNDKLAQLGHREFAKYFLSKVRKIDVYDEKQTDGRDQQEGSKDSSTED